MELSYCVPQGIPHSIFLGRPLPAPGEVMWTTDDRAKALAYIVDIDAHCPSCRQRRSEWEDESGKELRDPPFELVERVCPSCAVVEEWKAEKAEKKNTPKGIYPSFRRIPED